MTFKKITTLEGHTKTVKTVAFSLDGNLLASGSQDNNIILWHINEEIIEKTVLLGHD
jgi:WD40 repeat protein